MKTENSESGGVNYGFKSFPPLDRTSDTRVTGVDALPKFPDIDMPPVLKEKEVCALLRGYWKKNGFFVIRNQQGIGSKKGLSDFTVIKDGHVAFVEAKATKGKQSPFQQQFQSEVEDAGGTYFIVRDVAGFILFWDECYGSG